MSSPLRLLRAGPPPPKVALLPDALFFTRAVPVAAGATGAEAASQVELALEALSPFPLAQLYYGWFWKTGAEHAFVFAAYRRRFTTEQVAEWEGAELVVPAFCAVFGAEVSPATTLVLNAPESVTAVHWDAATVPSKVLVRTLDPEATADDRAKAREELLNALGGSRKVIDLEAPVLPDSTDSDRELAFRSGEFVSTLPSSVAVSLDVRDKAEFAALRAARKRDVMLWRVTLGCVAALVLLGLGELALVGGHAWQRVRNAKVRLQKPEVQKIMDAQALATRIEELATKRMLPFEMITDLIEDNRLPKDVFFTRVLAAPQTGIYTLTVNVTSPVSQVGVYLATLRSLPMIQRAEVRNEQVRGETETFTLVVTFKPDTLKPADRISQ